MSDQVRILDPEPIPYADLPAAGDEDLERQLDARYGGALDLYHFRLIELPLRLIGAELIGDLDAYLTEPDGPARHTIARSYRDAYLAGDDPAAIVVVEEDGWQVLDGFHRGAGARAAGRNSVAAYELLPD